MLEWLREHVTPIARAAPEKRFTSRLHSPAVSARIGVWLGVCLILTFITGWWSHQAQNPQTWVPFPTRPTWLYQVTQGTHVIAGTASIPLLLVKLWTVYPRLFTRPPRQVRELALTALERGSIAVLVASSIFQLATGLLNSAQWYPWEFHFRATHHALGWVAIGSLAVHIAVKFPLIRRALTTGIESTKEDHSWASRQTLLSRRGLVRTALLAAGVSAVATAGNTVPALRRVSIFAVRSGEGPQGLPVNKSALAARVVVAASSSNYRLKVVHGGQVTTFSLAELRQLPQRSCALPIACVEGWSATGHWSGIPMRALLDHLDIPRGRSVQVHSLQGQGPYRSTYLPSVFVDDEKTLIALELNGSQLTLDHGYPCRLIAPNRPGVLQTKWLSRLEVLT